VNIFGVSLGGMGPHNPREASASHIYGPRSSIEERCPVKALVAGASPVEDP
jgi:hypothetical protein